jgi:hypothetical protein
VPEKLPGLQVGKNLKKEKRKSRKGKGKREKGKEISPLFGKQAS